MLTLWRLGDNVLAKTSVGEDGPLRICIDSAQPFAVLPTGGGRLVDGTIYCHGVQKGGSADPEQG